MNSIDTVTFDVWNTLLVHEFYDDRVKLARVERIEKALDCAGFRFSRDDLLKAYDYSEASLCSLWKDERDASLDGHVALFLDGLGLEADEYHKDILRQPYADALLDFKPVMVEGAPDVLASLKKKGYRIGLISNTGRTPGETIRRVLDGYGILKYFDATVFSNELGYIKPNRRIFERALSGLGSRAANAVHVGDSVLLDIYGAREAGMSAILFNKYSVRFEKYATRYYEANGRSGTPDAAVERLADVTSAVEALEIK
ncbi:putative haloacid dehalogenase [Methanocella paludicola SANAE]|uniref:Haloacid dehalogenase n=1 Tax=Methanocella paludicola (strain DSM 17711 / JCM 13418 / NBRC 101707 / SANAE) TaxID=304371 RepID=D1Z2V8_METPS|nr:HAD family hydrolase [Methanocella paludicola]BAI63030.1 putative haloacid dehalogenase [Methanocella paludicola SANAE]